MKRIPKNHKRFHYSAFLSNGKEFNFNKKIWCEVVLKLEDIGINSVREDGLNPISGYDMVGLYN